MKQCDCQGERIAGLCIHQWEYRAHGEATLLRRSVDLHDRAKRELDAALAEVRRLREESERLRGLLGGILGEGWKDEWAETEARYRQHLRENAPGVKTIR